MNHTKLIKSLLHTIQTFCDEKTIARSQKQFLAYRKFTRETLNRNLDKNPETRRLSNAKCQFYRMHHLKHFYLENVITDRSHECVISSAIRKVKYPTKTWCVTESYSVQTQANFYNDPKNRGDFILWYKEKYPDSRIKEHWKIKSSKPSNA